MQSWPIANSYATGTYYIRIKTADNATYGDSGAFTITDPPPPAASITVTSPDAGDTWYKGSTHNITWTTTGISASTNMKINIFKDSINQANFVEQFTSVNDGMQSWPIANSYATGTYYIRIKTADNATYGDSGAFTITDPPATAPTITVTQPSSMWSFNAGGGMTIKWRTSNITGSVKISLNRENGTLLYLIKKTFAYNKYSIRYAIPEDVPTGKYFIKVEQGVVIGKSSNFRINAFTKSIIVDQTLSGSTLLKGKKRTLHWFSSNVSDEFVKIYLKPSNNMNLISVAIPHNSNGSNNYDWNISKNIPNGDYKIIITTFDDKIKGESKVFKIIDKRECDLAISKAEFCSGKLKVTLRNIGDNFVGNLSFLVRYKLGSIFTFPATHTLRKNSFVLFGGKTLDIEFKDYKVLPNIKSCSNKFDIKLKVDNDHLDMNTKNNKFSGTVYKDCNIRDCEKPDIFIDKIWTNFKRPKAPSAGDKIKTYAELKQSGKVYKSYSVRLSIYYHKKQFDHWKFIESKDFFINDVDFYKKVLNHTFTPQNRGYYVLEYKIDTYRIIEERDNKNNLKKKEIYVW